MKRFVARPSIITMFALAVIGAVAMMISSCHDSVSVYDKPNNPTGGQKGNVAGRVITSTGSAATGVEVAVGSVNTFTDSRGEFFLSDVPTGDRVIVRFTGTTYAFNQRITTVKSGKTSWVDATVAAVGVQQSFSATAGATVTTQGAKVAIPANAIVDSKGSAYTGTVQLKATWFDPSASSFTGCFPGEFRGVRTDNSETSIESFGFMTVDLLNGTEKLQLASSSAATLTFPIPASLRGRAPATIPLWYYDETTGTWVEQGSATMSGTVYIGTVKHFSSWNCDQPTQTSYLEGRVVDNNGNPLVFANVHGLGVDYTGASLVHTDDNGNFKLPVKSASQAKVWANYYLFASPTQTITTPATGATLNIGTLVVPIDSMSVCTIIGTLEDNGGFPVNHCYIQVFDDAGKYIDYLYTNTASFKFFGELGRTYTFTFNAGRQDTMSVNRITFTCPTTAETVNLGAIKLNIGGATVNGRVVDANSNPIPGVSVYTIESSSDPVGGTNFNAVTDSLGKFSLWVRPNITFECTLVLNKQYKKVNLTSGILGSTSNAGDIVFP